MWLSSVLQWSDGTYKLGVDDCWCFLLLLQQIAASVSGHLENENMCCCNSKVCITLFL